MKVGDFLFLRIRWATINTVCAVVDRVRLLQRARGLNRLQHAIRRVARLRGNGNTMPSPVGRQGRRAADFRTLVKVSKRVRGRQYRGRVRPTFTFVREIE